MHSVDNLIPVVTTIVLVNPLINARIPAVPLIVPLINIGIKGNVVSREALIVLFPAVILAAADELIPPVITIVLIAPAIVPRIPAVVLVMPSNNGRIRDGVVSCYRLIISPELARKCMMPMF